jgi:hypothetical protein
MEHTERVIVKEAKKSNRPKPKGVENNEEYMHGKITTKRNYEESTMKVSEGESVTVFLCLHHVTSVHNIVLNYKKLRFSWLLSSRRAKHKDNTTFYFCGTPRLQTHRPAVAIMISGESSDRLLFHATHLRLLLLLNIAALDHISNKKFSTPVIVCCYCRV